MLQYKKLTKEQKDEIVEYYKNHSWVNTAEHFNTSTYLIQRVLDEYGVKQRSADENKRMSCLEKFGTEYAAQSSVVKQHHKESCLEKYGVDNFAKSQLFNERMKATCQERYGVDNPMQVESVKKTYTNNMQKNWGVNWYCQHPNYRAALKHDDSRPNLYFKSLLEQYSIPYKREVPVGDYVYDFLVGNYLVEINPSSTHNVTWGILKSEPRPIDYHYSKSIVAKAHGYHCIHVFDWIDEQLVVDFLAGNFETSLSDLVIEQTANSILLGVNGLYTFKRLYEYLYASIVNRGNKTVEVLVNFNLNSGTVLDKLSPSKVEHIQHSVWYDMQNKCFMNSGGSRSVVKIFDAGLLKYTFYS